MRPDTRPVTRRDLYRSCLVGKAPAEVLDVSDRERLVYELHEQSWTDAEIATHTRMSTYTTARIRARLGLRPNTVREGTTI